MSSKYDDSKLIFGLDIGTRNLVGVVGARLDEHRFRVAAMDIAEHDTRAMLDGQIHDIPKVAKSIAAMKQRLETKLGMQLSDVCIAAAGRVLKTVNVHCEVNFDEEKIVNRDDIHALEMLGVEEAYEKIRQETGTEDEYFCVGYSVTHYYLNGDIMGNLEEHKAAKIEAEMIGTFLPEDVVDGLYTSVENAGLSVANLTLEPIAAIDVAIPERFRLLNIALVDVGAGTSDICITQDGAVTAYGMIPHAGDELTEIIAKLCLTDFNTADRIKIDSTRLKNVKYKDVLELNQTMASKDIVEALKPTIDSITAEIGAKIKELNGGKSVSAVFVVGGGGKVTGFTDSLAKVLDLAPERVALRGKEVLHDVEFDENEYEKDPLLVTPIGICYSYYEARNNFIYVTLNGDRIKLYDNGKLTVLDVIMQEGYTNDDVLPKRGRSINFTLGGERRIARGELGEAAEIKLNGIPAGISKPVEKNDSVTIVASTTGPDAEITIADLKEMKETFTVRIDDREAVCPRLAEVNGELVSGFYSINDGDEVVIRDYYTLSQILEMSDLPYREGYLVNNAPADKDTKVFDQFSITSPEMKSISTEKMVEMIQEKKNDDPNKEVEGEALKEAEKAEESVVVTTNEEVEDTSVAESFEDLPDVDESDLDEEEEKPEAPARDITVMINNTPVTLSGKANYIFVDVLDKYKFDMSSLRGELVQRINGRTVHDFMGRIHDGDKLTLKWSEDED